MRLAVEAGLFCPGTTYFDYGCGHGADIDYLQRLGFTSGGWDPHFRPDQPQLPADVVNIGYVINVIEDTAERRQALLKAWSLTQKVLIVAAQVLIAVTPGRDRPTRAPDPAAMAPQPPPRSPQRQSLPRWPPRSAIAAARKTPNPGTQGLTVGS